MKWYTLDYLVPPVDTDVLCLLEDGSFRVCYYFDGRFAYSVNSHWGFSVIGWRYLENKKVVSNELS